MYKIEKFMGDKNNQFYFHIVADDGEVIARSKVYKNEKRRDREMESLPFKMLELQMVNIDKEGLTVILLKQASPNKITWDNFQRTVNKLNLKGHVIAVFDPNGEFTYDKLTKEKMEELGWVYQGVKK